MKSALYSTIFLFSILIFSRSPAWGQDLAPHASVVPGKRLIIDPNPFKVKVGETQKMEIMAIDENSQEIPAGKFSFVVLRSSGVVPSSGVLTDSLGNIKGMAVGTYNLVVFWTNQQGVFLKEYVEVQVQNWEPAQIEIKNMPQTVMEGSLIPLDLVVHDARGVLIADASPEVTSSNPQVAVVDAFHQVRTLKGGKASIKAAIGKVETSVELTVTPSQVTSISLSGTQNEAKTGDVVYFQATAYDHKGKSLEVPFTYGVASYGPGAIAGAGAVVRDDGAFVAEEPGFYTINANAGGRIASQSINILPRNVKRDIEVVGRGTVTDKHTTDFWLWEGQDQHDYAVTGTFSADGMAYFWDITNPSDIIKIDSIMVDARNVNDVKISEDGQICVISREGASNRKNGIVILDVSNPRDVRVLSEYSDRLTGGVHNLFIYRDHVYALSNGQHYEIINIEDPAQPRRVGRFEIDNPARAIHDVWVEDGIVYSSNWNDGVIMVDIGNGVAGGSPENPVEISRTKVMGDANHTTFPFRSPSANKFYVVAGDEIFPIQWLSSGLTETLLPRGYVHFIDWTDKENPREVASYQVPEAGAHNYWIEDEVLYIGYYTGGVRVVDISGELMGDLYKQGREMGYFIPRDRQGKVPNMAMTWGARPFKGHVFFTDMNTGLWAVKVSPQQPPEVPVSTRD